MAPPDSSTQNIEQNPSPAAWLRATPCNSMPFLLRPAFKHHLIFSSNMATDFICAIEQREVKAMNHAHVKNLQPKPLKEGETPEMGPTLFVREGGTSCLPAANTRISKHLLLPVSYSLFTVDF